MLDWLSRWLSLVVSVAFIVSALLPSFAWYLRTPGLIGSALVVLLGLIALALKVAIGRSRMAAPDA